MTNPPVPFRDLADAADRLRRASRVAMEKAHASSKEALPKVVLTIGQAEQLAELIEKTNTALRAATAAVEASARELGEAPDTVEVL